MLQFELAGEMLVLSCERAVHWPRQQAVIIADPHFGKAAAFRSAGIPIPHGTTRANLDRLRQLLDRTRPERLVVLGDFFHARSSRQMETLAAIAAWREEYRQLTVELVRGNHDRSAGDPPAEWDIRCADNVLPADPFCFVHEPQEQAAGYVLAGHVHPALRLSDPCGGSLRAPCFWFGRRVGILPAFGHFTGMHRVTPVAGDRVFVVGPDAVVEVPVHESARVRKKRNLAWSDQPVGNGAGRTRRDG